MDTAGSLGAARTGARDRDATMSVATSVVATLAPSRLRAPSPAPRRGRRAHCVFRRWVRHASSAPTPAPTRRVAAPGASCVAFAATGPARRRASARASAADARLAAPASSADDEGEDARTRDPTDGETRAEGCSDDDAHASSSDGDAFCESDERSSSSEPSDEPSDAAASDGFKELVKFTLPTMAIWMCGPILSMVDTAVVGTASTLELAAMTPGGVFVDYPAYLIASSLATATTTLVARDRLIKNKKEADVKCEKTIADGIALASIGGISLAIFLRLVANDTVASFAGPASAAVVPSALRYAFARTWGVPAAMIVAVAQAAFLACKAPKQPLLAVAVAAVANLAGDLFLVVVAGWGIAGAAWATVAAQASMAVALVILLLRGATEDDKEKEKSAGPPRLHAFPLYVPRWKDTFRFLQIAGPVFYLNAIKIIFVAGLVQSVTAIGPECAAASGVLSAVYFFFAVMGDGVSQAAQTFLPPSLGTRRAVRVSVLLLVSAACLGLFNGLVSCVIAVAAPQIFTNSEVVANIIRRAAPVMSFALAIHTASMGSEGCLLAARDVRFMSFWYLPNSLFAYVTLVACLTQMGVNDAGGAFGDALVKSGGFGRAFGVVGDVSARVLTSLGIVGASGAGGAAALWASMAHFNFMRLALNIGRMFVAGFSGKRGSPLLRPP